MENFNELLNSTRDITNNHYQPRVDKELDNHEILDWGDKSSQFKRFEILSQNIAFAEKSLLDIGCGLGDLHRHLVVEENMPKIYTGTDLVSNMIELAKEQQPDCNFVCCDVFSEPPFSDKFDVIYCSGVFNLKTESNMKYLQYATENSLKLTHSDSKIVFNFLHNRTPKHYDHCFYYNPDEVKAIIENYYESVEIIDNYLINDFTIIASKQR